MYKKVKNELEKKIIVPLKKVIEKRDGSISIKCLTKEDASKVKTVLSTNLGNNYTIEKEKLKNPRMKIVGIISDMSTEEIETDINNRNFNEHEWECKVVHSYKLPNNKGQNVIIEVTPEIYTYLKNNKNRIFVGSQCCKIYDDINIRPCFNCGRFGHNGKKCINAKACMICTENHLATECTNKEVVKCVNCIYANDKHHLNRETNHTADDTKKCPILKYKIKKLIESTDYPSRPTIPSFIGNYIKKTTKEKVDEKNSM